MGFDGRVRPDPSGACPPLVRLRLDVSYDGTDFSGWAAQPGRRTVQETLESAVATVTRLPHVQLTVAGRTDAGVHARGQVCHLDLPAPSLAATQPQELRRRLARLLPEDVQVRGVAPVAAGFDARFSALWRRYCYRIVDDPTQLDPLDRLAVLPWPRLLDPDAMNIAASGLLGEHDFAAFCRRRAGATTIRTLHELAWTRHGGQNQVVATVVADAFCHSMVRSLVGCLLAVGDGRRPVSWPGDVLRTRTRNSGVTVVPARGLTLEEVHYPPDDELAARASQARARRVLP